MTFVLGREAENGDAPTGRLGSYRALDGSSGAPLFLDFDGPHAMLVVGKRGYGKSYTLGVVAEVLARTTAVAPVIIDPMGVFRTLSASESVPATVVDSPAVAPDSLDPRSWCALLGLSPESGAGGLVWQAAQEESTLEDMRGAVETADAPGTDRRAARNHIDLADAWDVFDADGLDAATLGTSEVTVLDVSGLDAAPMNAVARGVGEALYRARVDGDISLTGITADIECKTVDGNIELEGVVDTNCRCKTVDGDVEIDQASGSFDVISVDGDIEMRNITANAISGKTSDGRFALDLLQSDNLDASVRTGDGDVRVRLARGISLTLDVKTGDGRIRTDLSPVSDLTTDDDVFRGSINGGDGRLSIRTGDGSVTIMEE